MGEHHITYRGTAVGAHRFVSVLKSEGLEVEWAPPEERRDAESFAEVVLAQLTVRGTAAVVAKVLQRWRKRHPKAEVEWREESGYR